MWEGGGDVGAMEARCRIEERESDGRDRGQEGVRREQKNAKKKYLREKKQMKNEM